MPGLRPVGRFAGLGSGMNEQLIALTKPIASKMVHAKPGSYGDYIAHPVIIQKLLLDHGPYSWRITEILRDDDGCVSGCVGELGLEVDGRSIVVQGAGDCERTGNHSHDGARLKEAESDAFKRAAMKIGPGLQLWSAADGYFVHRILERRAKENAGNTTDPGGVVDVPTQPSTAAGLVDEQGSGGTSVVEPSPGPVNEGMSSDANL